MTINKKFLYTSLIVLTLGASAIASTKAIGFFAPEVGNKTDVSNPEIGAIVLDSSDQTFYGNIDGSGTGWTALGGGGPSAGLPAGTIIPFAGTTVPTGYLLADGSSVAQATYPDLFAAIGTTWGSVDGTHFNLPNLQGVFLRGDGSQTISGITYAGTLAAAQTDQEQGHVHAVVGYVTGGSSSGVARLSGSGAAFGTAASAGATTMNSDGTNGTPRVGAETRPANVSIKYLIKI